MRPSRFLFVRYWQRKAVGLVTATRGREYMRADVHNSPLGGWDVLGKLVNLSGLMPCYVSSAYVLVASGGKWRVWGQAHGKMGKAETRVWTHPGARAERKSIECAISRLCSLMVNIQALELGRLWCKCQHDQLLTMCNEQVVFPF